MTRRRPAADRPAAQGRAGPLLAQALEHYRAGCLAEAEALCRRLLERQPRHAGALNMLGAIALQRGDHEAAVTLLRRAQRIAPPSPGPIANLANALRHLGRGDEALNACRRGLRTHPEASALHAALGNLLNDQGDAAGAIAAYRRALELAPDPHVAGNLADLVRRLGNPREAAFLARQALRLHPGLAPAQNTLELALNDLGLWPEAEAACRAALARQPESAETWNNLGVALRGLGRIAEATDAYRRALALRPDFAEATANLATAASHLCDWPLAADAQQRILRLAMQALEQGGGAHIMPFTALTLDLDPALQRRLTEHFVAATLGPGADRRQAAPASGHRLRIGYLSGDFRNHPVAHLSRRLYQHHDRAEFEIFCYSTGPDDGSHYRRHVAETCDRFVDLRRASTAEARRRIADDGIAILVDMSGHTAHNRLAILAGRPAPLQIHFLGYPGTLGADFVDYFVSDRTLTPPGAESQFREKLIFMPDSYQISDDDQALPAEPPRRRDEGLPEDAVVFCAFNSNYKIEPVIFAVWARILRRVPGSVLWLICNSEAARDHLRREARSAGFEEDRLVFAAIADKSRHLARHVLADLFLDTHFICGHTTANDALQMGLPLLTCPRRTFISRVSASLATALGLPELICPSLEAYEERAVHLAQHPEALAALRDKLAHRRREAPLFKPAAFVHHLEDAYRSIWRRLRAGLPPEHIVVPRR